MKLILLLTVLIHLSAASSHIRSSASIQASSIYGKQCMSNCVPYDDYNFCYLGWGKYNWEKCRVTDDGQVQYFTSMVEGDKPLCTSSCGPYGESYQWCFTGEGGLWDKCSTRACSDCSKTKEGYKCTTPDGNSQYCAPDPIYYKTFDDSRMLLLSSVGTYTVQGYFNCRQRFPRFSEDLVREDGVERLARSFRMLYNNTVITSGPITSIVTVTVSPNNNEIVNKKLPLVIRATLRRQFLNNVREPIPAFIEHQMLLMNRNPNDERGHLLASSLGGPMHEYNFAPQTPIVNRNFGGESYWYHIEGNIRDTLSRNDVDHIDWTLVVIYDDLMYNRRPIGFGLRYLVYNDQNVTLRDTGDMYFSNDPEGGCVI